MKESMDIWIKKLDIYVHEFMVFYKTDFETSQKANEKFTVLELGILNLLEWNPNLSMKETLQILNIPNSTLTSAINRLEKKDILHRKIQPEDKRTFILELSEKGRKITKERNNEKRQLFEEVLMALETDEERVTFLELINKINKNLLKR